MLIYQTNKNMNSGIEKVIINHELQKSDYDFLDKFGFTISNGTHKTKTNSSICFDTSLSQPYRIVWGVSNKEFFNEIKNNMRNKIIEETGEHISVIMPDNNIVDFCISTKKDFMLDASLINQWGVINRINQPIKDYTKSNVIDIAHIVIETTFYDELIDFYLNAGFFISDELINRGTFLRFGQVNFHHNIFIIKSDKNKINHIAFSVSDLFELISSGIFMEDNKYKLSKGPGFHPISSAIFWYFNSPFNFQFEYVTNEDYLTGEWVPRKIEFSPKIASKWVLKRV